MVKAVIFDCFGVLIGDGLQLVCQDLEVKDPAGRAFITEMVHLSNRGLIDPDESNRRITERLGMSLTDWRALISSGEVRNEAVLTLVRSLRPRYKTALLSNIGKGSLIKRFSAAELDELFDVLVPSAEVGMLKPDPEIYRYTARKLGVEPNECVFIDDREGFVTAATEVGMHGVWFRNADQTRAELDKIISETAEA